MTGLDSFDPRSWLGPARSADAGSAELPEAWRTIGEAAAAQLVQLEPPPARRDRAPLAAWAVSAALLLAGSGAAWLTG
jgi:hypothetical protein